MRLMPSPRIADLCLAYTHLDLAGYRQLQGKFLIEAKLLGLQDCFAMESTN